VGRVELGGDEIEVEDVVGTLIGAIGTGLGLGVNVLVTSNSLVITTGTYEPPLA